MAGTRVKKVEMPDLPTGLDPKESMDLDIGLGGIMQGIDWSNLPTQQAGTSFGLSEMEGYKTINESAQAVHAERKLQQTQHVTEPIITSPLPSIPAISQVGAAPFSGVVNWNAIPGGFQPLPQIAGSRKKLYQLSQFHGGIHQKSSPRDISDTECQEATNVTVSRVGRIQMLGDLKHSTSTGLTAATFGAGANTSPNAGYGWYIFKSGYSLASTPVVGDFTINVTQDGDDVQLTDGTDDVFLDIASYNTHVAPVYYAGGSGFYACDANFAHTVARQCAYLVDRQDFHGLVAVNKWVTGKALIDSPITASSNAANTVNVVAAHDAASTAGQMEITTDGTSDNGGWNGLYYIYTSWLFDNGCETGLTSSLVIPTISEKTLDFNISIKHTVAAPIGGDNRIEGARIYFKLSTESERWLLAEVSLEQGVRGALDSTFTPWDTAANPVFDLSSNITFDSPPNVYSYLSLNAYSANEMYNESSDVHFTDATCDYEDDPTIAHDDDDGRIKVGMSVYGTGIPAGSYVGVVSSDTSFELYSASDFSEVSTTGGAVTNGTLSFYTNPKALDVRYKTAVVGQQGVVFIGNVSFNGKKYPDGMMFSMPGKPAIFPQFNFFDSPSSDGSPITGLATFQDTVLQFKENAMYVINISNPQQFYAEAVFRDCGISNPCQVFTTAFGVIFANKFGCFIYDGEKVISLTSGKFSTSDWNLTESSSIADDGASVPSIGYDPRSQSVIVLKNIGHDATSDDEEAWIYNMVTQSWTEGTSFINNAAGDVQSNFQISPNGYLSLIQYDASNPIETPYTYNIGEASSAVQTITYITKDIDFGLPTQTKKIFKIYVTYQGNADSLTGTYGADGDTTPTQAMTNSETSDGTLQNAGIGDHNVATFTLDSHPSNLKSIMLKFTGSVGETFEINDISILYRPRPIK